MAGYLAEVEVEAEREQQESGVVNRYAYPVNQPLRVAVREAKNQAKHDWSKGPKYAGDYVVDEVSMGKRLLQHKDRQQHGARKGLKPESLGVYLSTGFTWQVGKLQCR
jgi:hypothetical protein